MQPARPAVPLDFPVGGLDVSTAFEAQPPQTTPAASNVRGYEPATQRLKGGARPGLAKFVTPQLPSGSHLVQCLDTVVWASTSALLDSADAPTSGSTMDDPSTGTRNPGRTVRVGGSGRQPNRNAGNQTHLTHFVQKAVLQVGIAASPSPPQTIAFTNPVQAGSLLLAVAQWAEGDNTSGVTDSQGNTYTKVADGSGFSLWRALAGTTGANTVSIASDNLGGLYAMIGGVLEYSGVAGSGTLDSSTFNFLADATISPWTTTALTALGNKELMLAAFGQSGGLLSTGDAFVLGVGSDQNPGNHNPFNSRINQSFAYNVGFGNKLTLLVEDLIGTSLDPSGSQGMQAIPAVAGAGGETYNAIGASFNPA